MFFIEAGLKSNSYPRFYKKDTNTLFILKQVSDTYECYITLHMILTRKITIS